MNTEEWYARALTKIERLEKGTTFEIKELFEEINWKSLSKGERIVFGKFFANEAREGRVPQVASLERGKNNHSRYVKQ